MTSHYDTQLQADLSIRPPDTEYVNPLAPLRAAIAKPWRAAAAVLLVAALVALWLQLWRLARRGAALPGPFVAVALVFGLFSLGRFAALAYVAVFMGSFDSRMMFSAHTVAVFLAVPFIYETLFAGPRHA
jgi:transcriptional regulator of nitric oxide reductase